MKVNGSGGAVGGGGGAGGSARGAATGGGGTYQERDANSAGAVLSSVLRCARRVRRAAAFALSVEFAPRDSTERSLEGRPVAAPGSSEDDPKTESSTAAAPMAPKTTIRRGVRTVLMIRCAQKC